MLRMDYPKDITVALEDLTQHQLSRNPRRTYRLQLIKSRILSVGHTVKKTTFGWCKKIKTQKNSSNSLRGGSLPSIAMTPVEVAQPILPTAQELTRECTVPATGARQQKGVPTAADHVSIALLSDAERGELTDRPRTFHRADSPITPPTTPGSPSSSSISDSIIYSGQNLAALLADTLRLWENAGSNANSEDTSTPTSRPHSLVTYFDARSGLSGMSSTSTHGSSSIQSGDPSSPPSSSGPWSTGNHSRVDSESSLFSDFSCITPAGMREEEYVCKMRTMASTTHSSSPRKQESLEAAFLEVREPMSIRGRTCFPSLSPLINNTKLKKHFQPMNLVQEPIGMAQRSNTITTFNQCFPSVLNARQDFQLFEEYPDYWESAATSNMFAPLLRHAPGGGVDSAFNLVTSASSNEESDITSTEETSKTNSDSEPINYVDNHAIELSSQQKAPETPLAPTHQLTRPPSPVIVFEHLASPKPTTPIALPERTIDLLFHSGIRGSLFRFFLPFIKFSLTEAQYTEAKECVHTREEMYIQEKDAMKRHRQEELEAKKEAKRLEKLVNPGQVMFVWNGVTKEWMPMERPIPECLRPKPRRVENGACANGKAKGGPKRYIMNFLSIF